MRKWQTDAMYKISITIPARRDILDIFDYIAFELQEPDIADDIINQIEGGILSLSKMPERIGKVKDKRLFGQGIRPLQVKNYAVFFRIIEDKKEISVVRILYSRRYWSAIL